MMAGGARRVLAVLALAATVAGACGATTSTDVGSEPPATAIPTSTPGQRPSPSLSAGAIAPPPGTSPVEIPDAGIAVPVPDGWQRLDAADLADETARRDLATTYPATASMLEAIVAAGDRTEVVFLAVGPASPADDALPANIAVLVSQPSVSGFLLEMVTGFIDSGLRDTLGVGEPEREPVDTPMGEAIRLEYSMPGTTEEPMRLVAWVIGAPDATVLITVMAPLASSASVDPDALIAASEVR